jgi:multicomponent Na+:H+ antiporter subunit A
MPTFAALPAAILALLLLAVVAPWAVGRFGRATMAVFALGPAAITVWLGTMMPAVARGEVSTSRIEWIPALNLALQFRLDVLSLVMGLVISGIGTAVLVYSVRYFPIGDDGLPKYSGSVLAFAAAMLILVFADNLILLVVGWELTGILSYLLIAHRVRRQPSRRAASQSLMVTSFGGLALLIGAILLGLTSGTFTLSSILADPPTGPAAAVAIALMLVGGVSKSAILPFHFWLPGAMAAPTPASAYLHAATMVKAGIYLFARLSPAFATLGFFRPALVVLGGATMILAGIVALRQRDLKLLLAYGTVSQLGLLTLLIGGGTTATLLAATAMLIAHALFKAPLFFVVGIISNVANTRDLTELSGLGRRMPAVTVLAVVAGMSMAGLPALIGFVAKEAGYAALLAGDTLSAWAAGAMVAGSAMTVAYTARFLWGAFATKTRPPSILAAPVSAWMFVPTLVLVVASVLLGVAPGPLDALLAGGAQHEEPLAAWHGVGLPLLLSAVSLAAGLAVFYGQRVVERRRDELAAPGAEPGLGYRAIARGVESLADRVTAGTQRPSLPVSLGAILVVFLLFPGGALLRSEITPGDSVLAANRFQPILVLVIIGLAITVLRVGNALAAVLLVGGIGYGVAVLYVGRGAPDLALTQILMETVTLVSALLVIVRMPPNTWTRTATGVARVARAVLAVGVGVLMTVLALVIPGQRRAVPVADQFAQELGGNGGHNIVNVILVDLRGWDTFGEISVLTAAAVGVSSLIFLRNPNAVRGAAVLPPVVDNPSSWLATDSAPRPSLLVEVATRLIFHLIVMFSLYVLFVGHDAPGGGFSGGLIVGIALALRYLAGGRHELAEAAPVDAGVVMGAGLLLASVVAAGSLIVGHDALTAAVWTADLGWLGRFTFGSATVFDIGVYLVVIGVVLELLRSFGAELDRQAAAPGRPARDSSEMAAR